MEIEFEKIYYGSRHHDIIRAGYLNLYSMITEMKDMRKAADLEIELTAMLMPLSVILPDLFTWIYD